MAAAEFSASHLNNIRLPNGNKRVYKDECVLSFDTPESEGGLYVSLKSFLGFGRDHVELYHRQTGHSVFVHIIRKKHEIAPDPKGDGPEKKITRLAIGVEGGFDPDFGKKKFEYEESYSIVLLPGFVSIPWPNDNFPDIVKSSVTAVLEAKSAAKLAELEALAGTWDGEARVVTKHANNLPQLDNGRKIPPSGWKCENCDLTQNLWLNLTDGSILCGRKFYDGSGGNDHAVQHYKNVGFPLAVKLGTITKDGKADVYSYDEDDMVEDPNLVQHLAHFGINIAHMEKTEKSMVELELDLNQKYGEWALLQEDGSKLKPMYGPGYTGLVNLGNSCYMNSIMQIIFTIPDFQKRFVEKSPEIFSALPADPPTDFNVQMAKLGVGLLSGKYSQPPSEGKEADEYHHSSISPQMFKTLIGRGHPDFSTKSQQDAQEFFLHFINVLERNSRHQSNPADCFKFRVEDRFQCGQSKKVTYTYRTEYSLPLPIPLEAAINKDDVAAYEKSSEKDKEQIVRPRVTLASCLEAFSEAELVEQFYSTAINGKTTANKTTRLATFPKYLLIHLKKFMLREDWTPMKLDVAVEMPDMLDLSPLRGSGLQPGEEPLPEQAAQPPPPPVFDDAILQMLMDMGFPPESCKKAAYFTNNQGLEAATSWLMEHVGDSDFADPFVPPGMDVKKSTFVPNEDALKAIMSMGFTRPQATKALKATNNDMERAADWIFSHQAELDAEEVEEPPQEPKFQDGNSVYQMVAFISHMGTSTSVGHYVCHILRDGHWVIYNDEKVALSENPPKDLAYLYLYKRL